MGIQAWNVGFSVAGFVMAVAFSQAEPVTIENELTSVAFDRQTGGIVGIRAVGSGHDFIKHPAERPLLWRLEFRGLAGEEVRLENAQISPPVIAAEAGLVVLGWNGLDLPEEPATLDVRVTCEQAPSRDGVLLRMWVENRSQRFGLWNVEFPVVAPVSEQGLGAVAIGRGTWGMLYDAGEEAVRGTYPSASLPMQFVLVQEGEEGLYLAAHDPRAVFKQFEVKTGGEFRVVHPAADRGVAGNDWDAPYPFACGAYRGDWMQGCKRYRAWALREAPWTRKGPLATRPDVPESIKGVCAWVLADGAAEQAVPAILEFAKAVGAPVGVHWYNWHEIPFDTYYPNYFPTKPGFPEGVAQLREAGVVVMPYINARLWDSANENFAEAKPFSTKDEQGEPIIEEYGSGAKLAVMCPSQPFWQDKVEEIVHRLGTECGVNAIYLDQIASAPPRLCFDKGHGHSLGSGDWWVESYRALLTPIKKWCVGQAVPIGLTTENNAEPYMDNVDGHLIWTPRSDRDIPMVTAVYSGYALYFASNRAFAYGDEAYCLCQARDFVWGTQLGWDSLEILGPAHAAKLAYLARLARLRALFLDYLVYGELVEVLKPVNELPEMTVTWDTPKGDGPVQLRPVHGALWRGQDGSIAALLANADTQNHPFEFLFDGAKHGFGPATTWQVSRVSVEETTELPLQSGAVFSIAVDVPQRDAVAILIRPVLSSF